MFFDLGGELVGTIDMVGTRALKAQCSQGHPKCTCFAIYSEMRQLTFELVRWLSIGQRGVAGIDAHRAAARALEAKYRARPKKSGA